MSLFFFSLWPPLVSFACLSAISFSRGIFRILEVLKGGGGVTVGRCGEFGRVRWDGMGRRVVKGKNREEGVRLSMFGL